MSNRWSLGSAFFLALATSAAAHGCSAGSKPSGNGAAPNNTGGFTPGMGGSANGGMTTGNGGLPPSNTGGLSLGGFSSNGGRPPDECGKLVQPAETVFIDASVTDTIITYEPIALFVMIDRSSSMVGVAGDPTSWPNAQAAITAFVQDPASTGIDIGLGAFPPMSNQQGDCTGGTDCGTPIVPIAPLPGNAAAIGTGLQQATPPPFPPLLTPTECGLNGMINRCVEHKTQTGEQCVAILVTDGAPTLCDVNFQNLVNIVAAGKTNGVLTFALSLPGANQAFLDQIAQAGGTNAAIAVGGGAAGQQQFLAALQAIRGTVSRQEKKQILVPISTPLPCQFTIPPPKDGKPFDKDKTDVEYQPPGGAPPQSLKYVDSAAACGTAANSWYYDDNVSPKEVLLCPATCDFVKTNPGASINIVFLCKKRETT